MNLKEQITKTDTLKNDLKLARSKINERILSGGGTIANTLNEVPKQIDRMLGNYSRVAFFEKTLNRSESGYDTSAGCRFYNIRLNVNFKITKAIVHWEYKTEYENKLTRIRHTVSSEFESLDDADNKTYRRIQISTDNTLKVYMADEYYNDQILTRIICIGE